MNAVAIYNHSEIWYKDNRICNFMYINEIFKNRTEKMKKKKKNKVLNVRNGLFLGNPKP